MEVSVAKKQNIFISGPTVDILNQIKKGGHKRNNDAVRWTLKFYNAVLDLFTPLERLGIKATLKKGRGIFPYVVDKIKALTTVNKSVSE